MCVYEKEVVEIKKLDKEDNRLVVIYARKSKITHKGDSIANQKEYCKEYARLHLKLPESYEFGIYEDEGKSGFYSDRPDFQRMIRDVERKKIRAIVCYKLDRISRKMSDLMNLIDYLNKYNVALLISSNNLNTTDANSKMMIQMLGVVAEFERDIITERLQDNLIELAKDGRWMGGITPTGYTAERSKYGSGKKKNAFTYLVPVPEEKALVQHIFTTFLSLRGLHPTAMQLNQEGYRTKNGAEFTLLAVKDIIRNPVYCIADEEAYKYFIDADANVYGELNDFDGVHGISVYNRTKQTKEESEDSTFVHPEFTKMTKQKDTSDWIVAVGKHEGFVTAKDWIAAQSLKEDIADKYNRPHRATNALLSGIIFCPKCNRRLNVITESGRYTHGKPRFKYACPNAVRNGKCDYIAVHGVEMDEYVVDKISDLTKDEQNYYISSIQQKIDVLLENDQREKDIKSYQKEIEQLEKEIAIVVKSLRTATSAARPYIERDLESIAGEISVKKTALEKLVTTSEDSKTQINDFEQIKSLILSFKEQADKATPSELISMIQTLVERIYVTRNGKEEICHFFIKGCKSEDYDDFFVSKDSLQEDVTKLCDSVKYCELHTHICRDSAKK